jgi:hypothetical protein
MTLTGRIFAERRKIVLPIIGFLVANLGVLGAVVWPLQQRVDGADEARLQATSELAAARRKEDAAKGQKVGKELAETQLREFYTQTLPKDFSSAVDVTNFWLGATAERSRLKFKTGQWDETAVKDSSLVKVSGTVALVGEYANVRRFLYEVETAEEFVIIEKVELSQPNVTQGGASLELTLTVATYFRGLAQPSVK